MDRAVSQDSSRWWSQKVGLMMVIALLTTWLAGCRWQQRAPISLAQCEPCQDMLQQIEYPDLVDDNCSADDILSGPPMTINNYQDLVPLELTIDECVRTALQKSKVMQKLGGVVVNSPAGATTLYDQALRETGSQSTEAALSQFDAQFSSSLFFNHGETKPNNTFFVAGADQSINDTSNFSAQLSKQTAYGTQFSIRNNTDYRRSKPFIPAFAKFRSTYDTVNQVEIRQPLGRGYGTMVNRIAGPNAVPGQYNGVMIARIRSDISLADFESAVRNLVRDVENNYWELYYSYRDLDTKISARDASREIWENRKLRFENGIGRPDEEAQARQQYLTFKGQAQNALTGVLNGQPGVLGSERNLRRLLGMPVSDGQIIRPGSDPATAPVVFDWSESQQRALNQRVELRRQKWTIRQRELECLAAKALNRWDFDLVAQYGFRGFGDNLFGSRNRPVSQQPGSAYDDLINGDLDDWQLGVEFGGPIGNRNGHLAIRNAELNLSREKTLLKEQQRQILHDLGAAYTEVDRAMAILRTSFNARVASEQELEPKRKRAEAGQDQIFFLLDAQQRAATAESFVHRSIADYNQALLNYSYTTGSLLRRYGIQLTEGPWTEDAYINAGEKAFRMEGNGSGLSDITPVSMGPYDQGSGGVMDYTFAPEEIGSAPVELPMQ